MLHISVLNLTIICDLQSWKTSCGAARASASSSAAGSAAKAAAIALSPLEPDIIHHVSMAPSGSATGQGHTAL